ncbi:hypothetical protein BH24ACT5_BH24ACT5_23370 [soil metagenome]
MTRFWRVVHLDPEQDDPWSQGGALHVDPAWQGAGRFDIPKFAVTLYLAETAAAAVGETFASVPTWSDDMLWSGYTQRRRHLVAYEYTGSVVELDDAAFLASRGYRPSDVVARNRSRSQELGLELWLDGIRTLRWWSSMRPEWRVVSIWAPVDGLRPWDGEIEVVGSTELSVDHPAVVVAAEAVCRIRT